MSYPPPASFRARHFLFLLLWLPLVANAGEGQHGASAFLNVVRNISQVRPALAVAAHQDDSVKRISDQKSAKKEAARRTRSGSKGGKAGKSGAGVAQSRNTSGGAANGGTPPGHGGAGGNATDDGNKTASNAAVNPAGLAAAANSSDTANKDQAAKNDESANTEKKGATTADSQNQGTNPSYWSGPLVEMFRQVLNLLLILASAALLLSLFTLILTRALKKELERTLEKKTGQFVKLLDEKLKDKEQRLLLLEGAAEKQKGLQEDGLSAGHGGPNAEAVTGDPPGSRGRLESEIDRLSARISNLQDDVDRLQDSMTAPNPALIPIRQELSGLATRVDAIGKENLESYFAKWKVDVLHHRLGAEARQALGEFSRRTETVKAIDDNRAELQKIQEKAGSWFTAIAGCRPGLQRATAANGAWRDLFGQFDGYYQAGTNFKDQVAKTIQLADLTAVRTEPPGELPFFDVVSGRSAEVITRGYERRLSGRLQQLQSSTEECARRWTSLRDEFINVLDNFYSAFSNGAAHPPEIVNLEQLLRNSLRQVRFQEIPVETNHTLFDPSLHEVIPGRQCRPELPDMTIVGLERRGFCYEGKVLRRALVVLSSREQLK